MTPTDPTDGITIHKYVPGATPAIYEMCSAEGQPLRIYCQPPGLATEAGVILDGDRAFAWDETASQFRETAAYRVPEVKAA